MPRWWERVSFCWCGHEEEEVGRSAQAPPRWHRMLHPSASDVPLRPSQPVLPTAPAGRHTQHAQNNRLSWLVSFGTTGCSGQGHGHLTRDPVYCYLHVLLPHFFTLLFHALVPFFYTSSSSQVNNPPLIAFSLLDPIFPHPSQLSISETVA